MNLQNKHEKLRGLLILPADVLLTPVEELDQELVEKMGATPGHFALTRTYSREPSKLIDGDLAQLIRLFRKPTTIVQAIARYAYDTDDNPEEILDATLPLLSNLVATSILLPDGEQADSRSQPTIDDGSRFGDFEVIRCLQIFPDSEVYQARYGNDFCALKIAQLQGGKVIQQRLNHEAKLLLQLKGVPTPELLICEQLNERFVLAQKWISGTDAANIAAEHRHNKNYAALHQLLVNIANTYAVLHKKGVLHGDVHPKNLIVQSDNKIILIDLGLAQSKDSPDPTVQRGGVAFFYEPEYAAAMLEHHPPPPVTHQGEQFSVAALLYQLATGHDYEDFDLEQVTMFTSIRHAAPKSFSSRGANPAPQLEACLQHALEIDPENRYPDMQAFAQALAACSNHESNNTQTTSKANLNDTQSDQCWRFCQQLLDHLSLEGDLFNNGLLQGPTASLHGGAAGIAYGLLRLASGRQSPELMASADAWLFAARRHQNDKNAYINLNEAPDDDVIAPVSIHHGPAGISFTAILLALTAGDLAGAELELHRYLEEISISCNQRDITLGRCSVVIANTKLISALPKQLDGLALTIRDITNTLLDEIWQDTRNFDAIGKHCEWQNIGLSHGWGGLLYTTLLWHRVSAFPLMGDFHRRLKQLENQLFPIARGLTFPWQLGSQSITTGMPGWCNGVAGLLHLFALLHKTDKNMHWLDVAERLAWHAWEASTNPIDLCCGSAGRGYALLEMYRLSTNKNWLQRAKKMANMAIIESPKQRGEQHPRYSLFKGELGLVLLADELRRPNTAYMPLMGLNR